MHHFRAGLCALAAIAVATAAGCGTSAPARLEYVGVTPNPPRLGDTVTVRFRAVDDRGLPLEGAVIRFSLDDGSGSDGGTPPAADGGDSGAAVTLNPTIVSTTQGTGEALTTLVVRRRVAAVVVIATSQDGTVVARSQPISVAGGVPSAGGLTFQCGPIAGAASGGIHAIGAYDDARHLIAGVKLKCFAHVADRNGDGLPGVNVSFLAEAGVIGSTATTSSEVVGSAEVLYKTGLPMPEPTDPGVFNWAINAGPNHIGEFTVPLWMHPWEWKANPIADYAVRPNNCVSVDCPEPRRTDPVRASCPGPNGTIRSPCIMNPRDNLVTLIAFTRGEEAFIDANNNGRYDEGEPFEDLTEPFVDKNDNGTWDPNEPFIDLNGNKVWDGKNGKHDESTLIWRQEKILWTGVPYDGPDGTPDDFAPNPEATFRILEMRKPNSTVYTPPFTAPVALGHFESVVGRFAFSDPWFNTMAQNGANDGCRISGAEVVKGEPETFGGGSVLLSYPPVRALPFGVRDAHDPTATPQPPAFPVAVGFSVNADCSFTASPEQGHRVIFSFNLVNGTVL